MKKHNSYMIIAPHPDDEINIAGALIYELKLMKKQVKIVFVTNGDKFWYEGKIRLKESIKALNILGVKQEDIIFLGYPDGLIGAMYNFDNDKISMLLKNRKLNYRLNKNNLLYKKNDYHNDFLRENIENDIYQVIIDYLPEVLIVNDYDNHPDHKAVSLIFDGLMGNLLKKNRLYKPIILKKFAYNGVWEGADDYYTRPFRKTFNNYDGDKLDIPYFEWKDRICYYVLREAMTPYLKDNIIYKALKKYRIELAFIKGRCICSRDIVYWQRRSDNLCLNAKLFVSSGEKEYINDFKYIDCEDLYSDKYNFSKYIWNPKDDLKMLEIELDKKSCIGQISIYESSSAIDNILNVHIVFDNNIIFDTGELNHNGGESRFIFYKKVYAKNLKIFIDRFEGENCGFTEFEVYEHSYSESNQFIKFDYRNYKVKDINIILAKLEKIYISTKYLIIKAFRKAIRFILT